MIHLFKYLKPYLLSVILVIVLLFVQANADLALPDYMSKIVNVGIQQGGIADSIPVVIRQESLDRARIFMSPEEQKAAELLFIPVLPGSPAHDKLIKKYPGIDAMNVYVLDSNVGEELGRERKGIGLSYAISSAVSSTGATQEAALVSAIRQRFESFDPMLLEQMGMRAVHGEYQSLGVDLGAIQTSYILAMGGWMLLLTLLSALATIMVGFLGSRTAAGIARDLRHDVFRTVEGFSFVELDTFSTASLITRSTNDITQIQMVTIMGLRMIFYAPIIGIGGVVRALSKASSMWWIIALAVSVLLAIIASVFIIALPKFKSIQALIDKLNLVVRENLSGMMVIRAFTMQDREASRFDKANKDLTGTMLFVTRVMVVLMPVIMLIMNLVSLLIIWVGAREVAQSQIRIGDMMAFMQYSMQIFFAFLMLSMMFIILPRASISADRVYEVLKTKPGIVDPENPESLPERCTGRVEFKNVGFRYAGSAEKVLSDISFIAEPGKTTAIIGTTGAGKSTLVSLIPRFYDVTEGSVTIDGVDVRSLRQKDLRDHIGFVPQKTSLFSGTIESNLRYAKKDASTEEIEAALEISQAKEFVDKNPEGIRAEISQGGGNVSGGQRQRLTIARALVKKASINIFDDSFSALDFTTDSKLRKALALRVKDSTVILVTQRVASIKGADQILVLDEGTMVGKGTHGELMDTCEVYRDIALSQLRQEELA